MKSLHIIIRNLTFFVLFHILINEENNIIKYVKCKQQKRMTSRQKLFHAISSANYKEVRKLVKNDLIDVNSKNDYEETPLHISALSNKQANGKILKFLLKEGADPNAQTEFKYQGHSILVRRTPLHWYAHSCDHMGIRILLLHGADERMKTEEGDSSIAIVEKIIEHEKEIIPPCELSLKYLKISQNHRRKRNKMKLKLEDFPEALEEEDVKSSSTNEEEEEIVNNHENTIDGQEAAENEMKRLQALMAEQFNNNNEEGGGGDL